MAHLTPKSSALELTALHAKKTWREISAEIERNIGIRIPPGTLAFFAKQRGRYVPHNRLYKIALGILRPPLIETPDQVLAWQLANRQSF